jgi:hypothetical protein
VARLLGSGFVASVEERVKVPTPVLPKEFEKNTQGERPRK